MADQLATSADLANKLQRDLATLNADTATLLLDTATGLVQDEVRQRLVEVVGDTFTLLGTAESWLSLPERPVTDVTAVALDGEALTFGDDLKRFGSRLWRREGWQVDRHAPATVTGTYTHGYPSGAQRLQTARGIVLAMCAQAYENATGVRGEAIDDYRVQWDEVAARMELSEHARRTLRRAYGRRAGLVRIGS